MAKEEIIIAGFGGQGVLSMGKILAYSGVMQDMEVSWMPSYGPEMRGGTANVTVILSDKPVSSPISHEYDTAIILNQQSLDKFEPLVKRRRADLRSERYFPASGTQGYRRLCDRCDRRSGTHGKYARVQYDDSGRLSEGTAAGIGGKCDERFG